jgi:hypothetical protein
MNEKWTQLACGLMLLSLWRPCPGATSGGAQDGTKRLVLHPIRQSESGSELRLLPGPQEMTDGDAFALYAKAVESLPRDLDWAKIRGWRQMPVKELPQDDVGSVLRQLDAALPLLEQAGKCKQCDWPFAFEGDSPIGLQACRNVVFLLALKARSQLARGDHAPCVRTLGTGFALARHLGAGPTAVHPLVGAAVVAIVCDEIELYIQQPGAPSLETALRTIPKPLLDEEHSDLYGLDEASRNRVRLILRRANRHVIALQYVETLRGYAVAGRWPKALDELKVALPDDPITGKPFSYQRLTETRAILEGPLPEGGGVKDSVRYELNL